MENNYLKDMFGMSGRTVLITGAAGGLGQSLGRALGLAGARIIVNDLRSQACQQAVQSLTAEGIDAVAAPFDVTKFEEVNAAVSDLGRQGYRVDVLISNAGTQNRRLVNDMTLDEWRALHSVHIDGGFNCVKAVLPDMMERQFGRIIVVSSVAGSVAMPGISAYATAKGALSSFTRALAVEYGAQGITANAIAPGFVKTPFTSALQESQAFQDFIDASVPLGRWAMPTDIAPAVVFLASAAGSYVNGHVLTIDGGLLAKM